MSTSDDVVIRLRLADIAAFVADGKAATMTTSEIEKGIRKLGVTSKEESSSSHGLGLWQATVGRLKYAVTGLVLGLGAGAVAVAKFAVSSVAQFQQVEVAYTNMLGSKSAADAQIKSLQNFANFTPFQFYGDTGIAKMAQQLEAVGVQAKALVGPDGKSGGILGALGDATASIGGTGADMSTAVRDIMTMVTRGKLTGIEVKDLSTHGVMISDYLERQFHLTPTQLEKLVSGGKISANTAIQAIVSGVESSKAAGAMKVQSKTLAGLWTTLKDEVTNAAVDVMLPYLPAMTAFLSRTVDTFGKPEFVQSVKNFFDYMIQGAKGIYDVVTSKGVVRLLTDLWDAIKWMFDTSLSVASGIGGVLNWLFSPFGGGGKTNADSISGVANALGALVDNGFSSTVLKGLFLYTAGMKAFGVATDGTAAAVGRLKAALSFLLIPKGAIEGPSGALGRAVPALTGGAALKALIPELLLSTSIVGVVGALAYHFSSAFRKEWDGMWRDMTTGSALDRIGGFFKSVGVFLGTAIRNGFYDAYSWYHDWFKFLDNLPGDISGLLKDGFLDATNWFIDRLNDLFKAASFTIPGTSIGFSVPTIPHAALAEGGTVSQAGWSMTGERGPELQYMPRGASVIPLPRVGEFAGGGRPIHTHVHLNGREIATAVHAGSDDMAARL